MAALDGAAWFWHRGRLPGLAPMVLQRLVPA